MRTIRSRLIWLVTVDPEILISSSYGGNEARAAQQLLVAQALQILTENGVTAFGPRTFNIGVSHED
jgi:hypothetical protein